MEHELGSGETKTQTPLVGTRTDRKTRTREERKKVAFPRKRSHGDLLHSTLFLPEMNLIDSLVEKRNNGNQDVEGEIER